MSWRTKPVAILTAVSAVLSGIVGSTFLMGILPAKTAALITLANAVVTAILGALAHGIVTPLARPRDAMKRPLVPARASGMPDLEGPTRDLR